MGDRIQHWVRIRVRIRVWVVGETVTACLALGLNTTNERNVDTWLDWTTALHHNTIKSINILQLVTRNLLDAVLLFPIG